VETAERPMPSPIRKMMLVGLSRLEVHARAPIIRIADKIYFMVYWNNNGMQFKQISMICRLPFIRNRRDMLQMEIRKIM
jgi:hypothetical protein